MQAPAPGQVMVINTQTKQDEGRRIQLENIVAAKTVADVIRTCLGPRAMLKMLMDPMGTIVMTNDGNAILREITVQHPAAKSMIEIARTQDEEVGDGTTSVIILAGEFLRVAAEFMEEQMHPRVVIGGYLLALDDMLTTLEKDISTQVDINDDAEMTKIITSCIGTKISKKWNDLVCGIAKKAVSTVSQEINGRREIDIKQFAKVEKVPGGQVEESRVLTGIMLNKDVVHAKMARRVENPRILLLDCNLEYKKGESQTDVEFINSTDFTRLLQIEEEYIKKMCDEIIAFQPTVLFTEKGISDLAQHYLVKAGITAIRRVRKSDNNRLARATGATICSRTDEIKEEDIGLGAGLFEVRKLGDEYFTFVEECKDPKACTILLRGASKDILMEVERNLQDAMQVTRNVFLNPRLLPGGGAAEMALSVALTEKAKSIEGVAQWPYKALARALEIVPRTLIQNCGGNVIRELTALRAKHAAGDAHNWGIDGNTGEIVDMSKLGIWDPYVVRVQTLKTAVETATMLLRIDSLVSGGKSKRGGDAAAAASAAAAGGMGGGGMGGMAPMMG